MKNIVTCTKINCLLTEKSRGNAIKRTKSLNAET